LDGLEALRVRGGLPGVLGHEGHEPGVDRQAPEPVRDPELGGARLSGYDDRQVDEVVGVAEDHDTAGVVAYRPEDRLGAGETASRRSSVGTYGSATVPSGSRMSFTIRGSYSLPPFARAQ